MPLIFLYGKCTENKSCCSTKEEFIPWGLVSHYGHLSLIATIKMCPYFYFPLSHTLRSYWWTLVFPGIYCYNLVLGCLSFGFDLLKSLLSFTLNLLWSESVSVSLRIFFFVVEGQEIFLYCTLKVSKLYIQYISDY